MVCCLGGMISSMEVAVRNAMRVIAILDLLAIFKEILGIILLVIISAVFYHQIILLHT